jgi:hypothetical protein
MRQLITVLLIVVGIIHLLPVTGALGSRQLAELYGFPVDEPNLEILMRHRAVLFGLLGLFLIAAAFTPALQIHAFTAGLLSVGSFLWLAWSVGDYSPQIRRVVVADIIALLCLVIAIAAYLIVHPRRLS